MIVVAGDVFSPRSTLGYPLQHTHGSMSSRSCIMLYAFTLSDCPMLSMRIYLAHPSNSDVSIPSLLSQVSVSALPLVSSEQTQPHARFLSLFIVLFLRSADARYSSGS